MPTVTFAAAMHRRLTGLCDPLLPENFVCLDDATLRSCGFSRQKMGYVRGIAETVAAGRLDFAALDRAADDEAFATLVGLKGTGRWTRSTCSSRLADPTCGPPPISACSYRELTVANVSDISYR